MWIWSLYLTNYKEFIMLCKHMHWNLCTYILMPIYLLTQSDISLTILFFVIRILGMAPGEMLHRAKGGLFFGRRQSCTDNKRWTSCNKTLLKTFSQMFTTNVGKLQLWYGSLFWVHLLLFLMASFSRQKVLMWFSFSKWTFDILVWIIGIKLRSGIWQVHV